MPSRFFTILKRHWRILAILTFALVIRLIYLYLFDPPITWQDANIYDSIAQELAAGNGYTRDGLAVAHREPGYSLFLLAPIYFIFGHSIFSAQIIQIFLSLITIYLAYRLASSVINTSVGLLTAFLLSLHHSSIVYSMEILNENFFTLVLFIAVYTFWIAYKKESKRYFFIAGILFGLAALIKFNTVLIFVALFFPLLFMWKSFRRTFLPSLLVMIGIVLMVTPWVVRNTHTFDTFILGRTGSGPIIWSGSYVPWDGDWLYSPYRDEMFHDDMEGLSDIEQDRLFVQYAIENIKEDPLGVAWIWAKKPFKIIFPDEMATYLDLDKLLQYPQLSFFEDYPYLATALYFTFQIIHLILLGLAIYGFVLLYKRDKAFALIFLFTFLYFMSTYLPLNAIPRYLVPLWPYLLLFDAIAIKQILPSPDRSKLT